jgi:hypothetical protein
LEVLLGTADIKSGSDSNDPLFEQTTVYLVKTAASAYPTGFSPRCGLLSLVEAWDVLHSAGRLFWKLTGIPLQLLAFPTVHKQAERYALHGCIRSQRNCEGRCHVGEKLLGASAVAIARSGQYLVVSRG